MTPSNHPPLHTILFDMGNVLVHFSHPRMCEQIAQVCDSTGEEIRQLLFDKGWQMELERGELSESGFQKRLETHFGRSIDLPRLIHAASDIFTLNAPLLPLMRQLRQQGLRFVLLSNTSESHINFVRREFPVLNDFDHLVLSYEVGAMKPDSAIFHAALQHIGCAPEQCFYTDDIAPYVDAGRRHGLQAEVFTTPDMFARHMLDRGLRLELC